VQVAGDFQDSRAGVQQHVHAVLDKFGRLSADPALGFEVGHVLVAESQPGLAGEYAALVEQRAAVGAGDVALAGQGGQVAAQGHLAHAEHLGQLGYPQLAGLLDQLEDFLLAFFGKHPSFGGSGME